MDDNIAEKYPDPNGKWMQFHTKAVMDEKWVEAVKLYRSGKLTGIHSMKVSTMQDNPRSNDQKTGVIIFYCGPEDEEDTVMSIGQNLLKHTDYRTSWGHMYYKSDWQTQLGTRATGNKSNSKYRIPVPKN